MQGTRSRLHDRPVHILAIGDSVVKGRAAPRVQGWVNQLRDLLRPSIGNVRVTNIAEGGNTSTDLAASAFLQRCIRLHADLIVIGVGVNDSRYRRSLSKEEVSMVRFRANMLRIMRMLHRGGAALVISGQVPVIDSLTAPYKRDKYYCRDAQLAYERVLASVASTEGALFVEHFGRWTARGEPFIASHLADGLHPNQAGHTDIARYTHAMLSIHWSGLDAHPSGHRE